MPKYFRPAILALGVFVLAGAGCAKQIRVERHLHRAEGAVAQGDYDKAETEYKAAISLEPTNVGAIGRLGSLYVDEGRILPGYLLLKRIVDNGGDDPRMRLSYGLACLTLGRTVDARLAAKKLLEGDPGNESALLLLVDTSLTVRDGEESRRIVESLKGRNRDIPGYHLALGSLLLADHDQAGAEGEFKKALEMEPKSAAANEGLGDLSLQRNDPKGAGEYFRKAADLSPIRAPIRLRYTDFLIRAGSLDEAKHRLDEINAKAPDSIPAWTESMRVAVAQSRFDDCLADAAKILARDPTNYDAMERRAGIRLNKGDPDGAIADLKVAQGFFPRAPLIKYQLALAYLKKSDDTAAEESLREAIQLAPNYDEALILLAGIRVQKGDPNSVITDLTPVLRRHPGEPRVELLLAQSYHLQGNLEQTIAIYGAIAADSPSAPSPPYLIGMALLEEGRRAEARASFERSVKLSEDYWSAQEMLVTMDLMDKRYPEAAARVAALVEKYPGSSDPWVLRSRVRLAQEDLDGAMADLVKAIDANPRSAYAYLRLAELYLKTHQTEKALERMSALAAKTNSKSAWMLIGVIQEQMKNFDASRDAYEKLLKIDPKFEPALNNLAIVYSEHLGQPEKAYGLARQARELAPEDPIAADTLGWILYRRGDFSGALPLIQEAAEKYPTETEIQYHLGMVHYMLGNDAPARQTLQKAISVAAESPIRTDASRRLAVLDIDPEKADNAVRADLERRARERADDPVLLGRLGRIQERDGDAAAAAASYESALKIAPKSSQIMLSLIGLYAGSLKNPDRARDLEKTVHQLAPSDARISWQVAKLSFQTGDFVWAATLLESASQNLSEPDFINDSAYAFYCAGRQRDAETELQKIGPDAPTEAQERAQRLSAMIAAAAGPSSAQAAQSEARKVLARDPAYVPALMVSALAREQDGDIPGACQAYEDLLARDPALSPAMRQLAVLYGERMGDDKKAEELATRARKSLPDDPAVNFELGAVRYRQGDFSGAVPYLQQSLSRSRNQPETLFLLGMSHYQLKNTVRSREELQQALDLKLSDREADETKRVLEELMRSEGMN